jgi:electron transport complex protein RnfG
VSDAKEAVAASPPETSSLRLIGTLFVAGAVSGLAIAGAYKVTKPIIDTNNAVALRRAIYKVVPGASKMQELVLRDGKLAVATAGPAGKEPVIYGAYSDGGKFLGYAIESSGSGFQDTISLLYGFDPVKRRVVGLEILESLETPGLGDKIKKDPAFHANFKDLAVEPEVVVVQAGRHADNQVDVITGATISSKAVVKIVNAGASRWLPVLPAAGAEPGLRQAAEVAVDAKEPVAEAGSGGED